MRPELLQMQLLLVGNLSLCIGILKKCLAFSAILSLSRATIECCQITSDETPNSTATYTLLWSYCNLILMILCIFILSRDFIGWLDYSLPHCCNCCRLLIWFQHSRMTSWVSSERIRPCLRFFFLLPNEALRYISIQFLNPCFGSPHHVSLEERMSGVCVCAVFFPWIFWCLAIK